MPLLQPLAWPSPRALLHALWHGRSVRAQLLIVFIVIDVIAGLVAGAVTILQARASTSTTQRKALYTQAVQLMQQELNIIYLWDPKYYLGVSKTVTGVQYFPDALIRLEYASVS